ncbi:hypothetical protein [Hugenholtzia roseola]|uniref:hypothetical protein n=1 Tax=Hugenholtzia roseola TaxID=1002 RepID=UPI00040D6D4A|nr:hypothetical protein [Hugenholtzia roseola]
MPKNEILKSINGFAALPIFLKNAPTIWEMNPLAAQNNSFQVLSSLSKKREPAQKSGNLADLPLEDVPSFVCQVQSLSGQKGRHACPNFFIFLEIRFPNKRR